ncbi:MAG: PAS domain S-box protein, partial [Bacteroidales bacterium]|nr:PAS domain S-box protein [Bacteroidales bacterium]
SEQKFKELDDLSPTGIFIYQNNNFVYVNKATCNITGYSEQELLSMKFWDVVHEDMKAIIRERGHKRMRKEDVINRYEIKLRTKKGTVKWIDFSTGLIMYQGTPSGIGNIFDITDMKKAQVQLIEAKKKAEESDRLKSAFLANMSHEIRTPMNGIVGFSELLAVGDLPDKQKQKYIQIIRQSSDQLLHIINDILDISKIEVGEVKIIKSEFNISHLLLELKSLFAAQIKHSKQKNIELMLDYKLPKDKEILFSDRFRLHQIISNLINNALKFTEKGFVAFGARFIEALSESNEYPCGKEEYNRVLFFVKDSGAGISPKMQNYF